MSVYYTQIEKSKLEYTQFQFNATQLNKTTNSTTNQSINESNLNYIEENNYWQPEYTQKKTQLNIELEKPIPNENSIMRDIGLIVDNHVPSENETQLVETRKKESVSFNPASPRIIIDETIMSSSSNSPQPTTTSNEIEENADLNMEDNHSDSISSKNSNILDQNLDTLELESDTNTNVSNDVIDLSENKNEPNKTIDLTDNNKKETELNQVSKDENDDDEELISFLNKTTEQSFLENSNKNKKRKSEVIIDLDNLDSNSSSSGKKFKQDQTVEIIEDDEEVSESSKSSTSLPNLDLHHQESNSCEVISNKSNEIENNEAQVLKMIEKSLIQANNECDLVEQENALGNFQK